VAETALLTAEFPQLLSKTLPGRYPAVSDKKELDSGL
jgi:hypothetical protein